MFISKLNTIRNSLTPAEVKIANYIQNNLSQLKTITSQELAEEIGIAQSTIIRFSKNWYMFHLYIYYSILNVS